MYTVPYDDPRYVFASQEDLAEVEANTILGLMDLDRDGSVSVDDFMASRS